VVVASDRKTTNRWQNPMEHGRVKVEGYPYARSNLGGGGPMLRACTRRHGERAPRQRCWRQVLAFARHFCRTETTPVTCQRKCAIDFILSRRFLSWKSRNHGGRAVERGVMLPNEARTDAVCRPLPTPRGVQDLPGSDLPPPEQAQPRSLSW